MFAPHRQLLPLAAAALAALLVAAAPTRLNAQAKRIKSIEQKKAEFEITRGVWLQGGAGLGYMTYGGLETALAQATSLSFEPSGVTGALPADPFAANALGSRFGIQLGGIWRRRLVVQLVGEFMQHRVGTTFKGEARLSHIGLGAQLGYAIINRSGWLLYPYAGFTTGTSTLEVQNTFIDPINFGSRSIGRSRTGAFDAGLSTIELGVSTRHTLAVGGRRGRAVLVGADLGASIGVGGANWADGGGAAAEGVEAHRLTGGYLRITLGGALFESDKPMVRRRSAEVAPAEEKAPDVKDLFKDQAPSEPLDVKQDPKQDVKPDVKPAPAKRTREARPAKDSATKPKKTAKPKRSKRTKDANYDESEFDKKN